MKVLAHLTLIHSGSRAKAARKPCSDLLELFFGKIYQLPGQRAAHWQVKDCCHLTGNYKFPSPRNEAAAAAAAAFLCARTLK